MGWYKSREDVKFALEHNLKYPIRLVFFEGETFECKYNKEDKTRSRKHCTLKS